MIVEQLGVTSSGGITTAGCQNEEIEGPEQEELLPDGDVTLFRGVAARANYLGPDSPDMLYASKEERGMLRDEQAIGRRIGEDDEDRQVSCRKTQDHLGASQPGAPGGDRRLR